MAVYSPVQMLTGTGCAGKRVTLNLFPCHPGWRITLVMIQYGKNKAEQLLLLTRLNLRCCHLEGYKNSKCANALLLSQHISIYLALAM